MADGFGGSLSGAKWAQLELTAMQARTDVATVAALKKIQRMTKASIKAQMRGRPRYDHRGKSQRTGPHINLNLSPHHVSKGGGPGKLTGALAKSIKFSKKPRLEAPGTYSGVVLSGGAGGPQNLYKGEVELEYPYFAPGVNKAEPKMPAVWAAAWAKSTATKK